MHRFYLIFWWVRGRVFISFIHFELFHLGINASVASNLRCIKCRQCYHFIEQIICY